MGRGAGPLLSLSWKNNLGSAEEQQQPNWSVLSFINGAPVTWTHTETVCARKEEDYKAFIERWFPAKERGLGWWEKSECFCWHLNNGEHAAVMRLSPADRRPCVWLQWNVGAVSHETKLLDRCWARLWRKTQCSIFPLRPLFNNRIFFFFQHLHKC